MSQAYDALTAALEGQRPVGFEDVAEEDLQLLADAITRTLDDHARALERETEESLRYVPRLVRPAVRKIVGL